MAKQSAGLLMFRVRSGHLEVFLAHMGGPFWACKDQGAWSIAKGEFAEGEEPIAAATPRSFFQPDSSADEGRSVRRLMVTCDGLIVA
jgi:predicted NUDIX family NTP pyrophosphohydrolase